MASITESRDQSEGLDETLSKHSIMLSNISKNKCRASMRWFYIKI